MAISRIAIRNDSELQKIVEDDIGIVERDLTVICSNMPIDSKTNLDMLCHDDDGQLVILKMSTKENDNMFFEGLKILAYINNVKPLLKFSYKDYKINDTKMPRLVFLAPSFSPQLIDVVGQMQGIQMDLYQWEYFEFDDKKALHLEPAWLSDGTKSKPKRSKPERPERPKSTRTADTEVSGEPEVLTEEVIMPPTADEVAEPEEKDQKERGKKKSIFSL
jgi:hypothetical protein